MMVESIAAEFSEEFELLKRITTKVSPLLKAFGVIENQERRIIESFEIL